MNRSYALKTKTPESLGIPSSAVLQYLKALDKADVNMHGFILARHGCIAAEGYYAPFKQGENHRMYSTSKSFTSFAIGLLVDDGILSLDDKIADFFPEKMPDKLLHPYVEMMTIRHLLMMSTCFAGTTYKYNVPFEDPTDWVATFFACPPERYPGQTFMYDTSGSTVLGALVEKLTGMTVVEFLRSRGFRELGFSEEATAVMTESGEYSWMGAGVLCSLRDLALFAQVCMNKGEFAGKRIISEEYIMAATSKQIDNSLCSHEWGKYGYGYQFWMSRAGFNCSGMGGQMAYCLPGKDAFLVTIADTQAEKTALDHVMEDAFHECIVSAMCDEPLPEDEQAYGALMEYISALHVKPLENKYIPETAERVSGKNYKMNAKLFGAKGTLNWDFLRIDFTDDGGILCYTDSEGEKSLAFGYNTFVPQNFPGFASKEETEGKPILVYGFHTKPPIMLPCMTSAAWMDENTLNLLCHAIGAFLGILQMQIVFDENKVTVQSVKFSEKFWEDLQGWQSGQY